MTIVAVGRHGTGVVVAEFKFYSQVGGREQETSKFTPSYRPLPTRPCLLIILKTVLPN